MTQHPILETLLASEMISRAGRVRKVLPTAIEADGPAAPLGTLCMVESSNRGRADGSTHLLAEIVAVHRDSVVLAPLTGDAAAFPGAKVTASPRLNSIAVGDAFLGRAIDGLGRPIDGKPPIPAIFQHSAPTPEPFERTTSPLALRTGVRAIDAVLTLGHGQRVGVFAASGVGKTSLLVHLARNVEADCCVVCLVGERGREVEAFWSQGGPEANARTTLVAATSDQPAALRVRSVHQALALAEHWRDAGKHVLFLLDSITRLAMALREIGLAAGEPPTVRAYTPSVFAALPAVVERCGAMKSGGAITAIMSVLSETDDNDDPVCETMKALLDGHIVLSRSLAEQGHYPAIDVTRSISRLADYVSSPAQRASAAATLSLLGAYEASRTLIEAGVYVAGTNPDVDRAVERRPSIMDLLKQERGRFFDPEESCRALAQAVGGP